MILSETNTKLVKVIFSFLNNFKLCFCVTFLTCEKNNDLFNFFLLDELTAFKLNTYSRKT